MQRERALAISICVFAGCNFLAADAAFANVRVCQEQEQRYAQIKSTASPVEINALLAAAADKGCTDLARRLLDAGASLASRDRFGAMPLSHAATAGRIDIVDLFLMRGAAVNARDLSGSTALFLASEEDRLAVAQMLIARGADVNLPGKSGVTPLAAAAYMGDQKLVRLLLESGADPKIADDTGKTPICYAGARAYASVVRVLLDHGIAVNARYGNDLTALMWIAGHDDGAGSNDVAELITLFIERGARLDDQDNRGRTALMIAASLGRADVVNLLLQHGASKSLRDKGGKSAADLAATEPLRIKLAAN